jgi:hypothetical protein
MHWRIYKTWVLTAVILCSLIEGVNAQQGSSASHLRPQHKAAVEQWLLSRKLALRVATLADCSNEEGLANTRKERGKNYHSYYAVGDFNGDRKQDFAVALIRDGKRNEQFAIAIFNGPFGRNSVPAYFVEGWDLGDGGLFIGGGDVIAGPFESDNCVILRPRGKKYVIKDCL